MFLEKYVNGVYLDLIYSNYDNNYLNMLDENNFKEVYKLLKENNIYYLDDIIVNYLELFEIEPRYLSLALNDLKNIIGNYYIEIIGNNMTLLDKVIKLAISYSDSY